MNFYFNGCSFTYGDELKNPHTESWPTLVSNHFNVSFLNNAVSGGTNQRTVYKTLLNKNKFDYFIIAWTAYTRFTEYNPVDNYEINFNPNLTMNPSLHISNDLKKNYSKYKKFGELYYKCWYNELYKFKTWLQEIILLQSFFKTQNKNYLMINTFKNNLSLWLQPKKKFISSASFLLPFFENMSDSQLEDEHDSIQQLVEDIDKSKFIGWNHWCIEDLTSIFPIGPNGHLLKDGHKAIAEKIITHIEKNDSN